MSDPQAHPAFRTLSVRELADRVADGTAPRTIDVREPYEWSIAHLDGAELRPLSEIRRWWRELDPAEEIVFYCHHGVRSANVCRVLAAEGFSKLSSLDGGINAWAAEIDPAMARY
jgi:rhodanese-related sulfurtransferase